MTVLDQAIAEGRNSLSADRLDMSFGELLNMYQNGELIIDPEFQRLFRWDLEKRTKFIESVILGIPIPSMFVAEDDNGKWEVVDGLQRISTILSFFGILKNDSEKNNWRLEEGDIVPELKGLGSEDLPLKIQLNIKRSVCRIEVIKWDSQYDMRYELFRRLNTGGASLTDQEIRNCIFRGISPDFTNLIKEIAASNDFHTLISPTSKQEEELYLDELVLRFFSVHENHQNISKKLSDHMTDYMREATKKPEMHEGKDAIFLRVLNIIKPLGKEVFRAKNRQFSTSLYDGIFNGIASNIDYYESLSRDSVASRIEKLKNDEKFKEVSGVASNYKERTKKRIERAIEIFSSHEN